MGDGVLPVNGGVDARLTGKDAKLYEALALVDALRIGRAWEKNLAQNLLM